MVWSGQDLPIDNSLVRFIEEAPAAGEASDFLLVSDTANHCVVLVDLEKR